MWKMSKDVISQKTLEGCFKKIALTDVNRVLSMYNQTVVTPKGQCTIPLTNLKNGKLYKATFMVLAQECTPLLGSETIQEV